MGLRYTNWHTTALCSPTRSSLLTGRNAHSNGMTCIVEGANGFPGLSAGLTVALVSISEGMAYALLAGVNPIYGLYTGMVTTVVASRTS